MKLKPQEITAGLAIMEMLKTDFPQMLEIDDDDPDRDDLDVNGADLIDAINEILERHGVK